VHILRSRAAAARLLAQGGVVLLPTDTVPGLHCRADCAASLERLAGIKQRPAGKPFLVLCASLRQVRDLAEFRDPRMLPYSRLCWPGPFTLVLGAGPEAPAGITGRAGTVAVRVPDSLPLRRLISSVGAPLASTSANWAGQAVCTDMGQAARKFDKVIDGVLLAWPAEQEAIAEGRASALIDLTAWPPRQLRRGPLAQPRWRPEI
jgi:L-threonylcarbamoyladenylate synthase